MWSCCANYKRDCIKNILITQIPGQVIQIPEIRFNVATRNYCRMGEKITKITILRAGVSD